MAARTDGRRRPTRTPAAGGRRRQASAARWRCAFLGAGGADPARPGRATRSCTRSGSACTAPTGAASSGSTTTSRMFTAPETRRAITNNVIWVVVAPTIVTVARPDLRGAHRAGPAGHRAQDHPVHADGDLVPRRRRHLPAGLRREPGPGRAQRRRRRRARHVRAAVGVLRRDAPRRRRTWSPADGGFRDRDHRAPATAPSRCRWSACPRTGSRRTRRRPRRRAPGPTCAAWSGSTSPAAAAARRVRSTPTEIGPARRDGARPCGTARSSAPPRPTPPARSPFPGSPAAATRSGWPATNFTEPFRGVDLARPDAGHAGDHRRVHLDLGRLRHGADRGRAGRAAPGGARGGPGRRRHRVAGVPAGHRPAAAAGAGRRAGHADHQRAEDLRPGLRPRRRSRSQDDANVVALEMYRVVVRRRPRLRARQRARACCCFVLVLPGDAVQHPAAAEGPDDDAPSHASPRCRSW